jgi:hypothetical protein
MKLILFIIPVLSLLGGCSFFKPEEKITFDYPKEITVTDVIKTTTQANSYIPSKGNANEVTI